jgi:two-component system, cell cycle response regulator DivK
MATVLIVEDNEVNREMLSRRLERRGYAVRLAVDGLQGVAMATVAKPDLVLMDLSLPGIDGWEATRRLKADAATRALPVIALTAHAMAEDRAKALAAGCDDFDTKPVDLPRLLDKMERLLAHAGSTEQAPLAARAADAAQSSLASETCLPAVAASLPGFKVELEHFCTLAGMGSAAQQDLQVVLDELCANVFAHAYPAGRPGTLRMELRRSGAAVELTLCDLGQPFNPLAQTAPDTSLPWQDKPIGGLGIHLVQRLTDSQRYSYSAESGNRLTVVKRCP